MPPDATEEEAREAIDMEDKRSGTATCCRDGSLLPIFRVSREGAEMRINGRNVSRAETDSPEPADAI